MSTLPSRRGSLRPTSACGSSQPACRCLPSVADAFVTELTATTASIRCFDGFGIAPLTTGNPATTIEFDCSGNSTPPTCELIPELLPAVTAPLIVSRGVDNFDNVCSFGCTGEVVSTSNRTSVGYFLGTGANVTDAQGNSGPGLYNCDSAALPSESDICTCDPIVANATVVPIFQEDRHIPQGYPRLATLCFCDCHLQ